jgi:putative membrane protein
VTSLVLVLIVLCSKYGSALAGVGPSLWVWALLFLLAVLLGQWIGRWGGFQRLILPRGERKEAVHQRALLEFHEAGLNKTEGETGILLFVSLLEHEAVVLFDKGIARHCTPEVFQNVVAALIEGAKTGDLAGGYQRAIALCTDVLSKHFPPRAVNPNELKDYLRIEE